MDKNKKLFEKSQLTIPGGVNSPVRAFGSVGGNPIFFKKARGSRLWDENDKEYIDFINSWGPMILGHAHPEVIKAVKDVAEDSLSFGAPTERELIMAETIVHLVPSIEQVRLVSSGTEATMSAIRLARGYTSRDKIVKFEGCYHGHADSLLVKAGSGALTFGQPNSAGVPKDLAKDTLTLPFNNTKALKDLFNQIKFIEESLGRKKAPKNYPRICDIDIIDFNGECLNVQFKSQKIIVPHINMHKRNFVLIPLYEINQKWLHPKFKKNIVKLVSNLPKNDLISIKFG